MGKYAKYLSFLAITLLFSIKNVYAEPISIEPYNIKQLKNVFFDTTFVYGDDTITITQTTDTTARFCVNTNCYNADFTYPNWNSTAKIVDEYGKTRLIYEIWEVRTTGGKNGYLINFANVNFYMNVTGEGHEGNERITFWGGSSNGDNNYIDNQGIISTATMDNTQTWFDNTPDNWGTNYYTSPSCRYIAYYKQAQTWFDSNGQRCFIETGSEYRLIYSNISTGINKGIGISDTLKPSTIGNYVFYNWSNNTSINNKYVIDFDRQIESLDIYAPQDQWQTDFEIEIESEETIPIPTAYQAWGKKCRNNTCYWQRADALITITNDTYTTDTNYLKIAFNLVVNNQYYDEVKIAIKWQPKNGRIKINDSSNNYYRYDLNNVGSNYSLETTQVLNEVVGILVNNKNIYDNSTTLLYNNQNGITLTWDNTKKRLILNGTASAVVDIRIITGYNQTNQVLKNKLNEPTSAIYTLYNNLGLTNYWKTTGGQYIINRVETSNSIKIDEAFIRINQGQSFTNKELVIGMVEGTTNVPIENNYRYYIKRDTEWGNITTFAYRKNTNEIKDRLYTDIYEINNSYLETGTINLGVYENEELYLMLTQMEEGQQETYNIYFNENVYYTKGNKANFDVDYAGTTEIRPIISNSYVDSEFKNVWTITTPKEFYNIVNQYMQYKDEWLEIFYSIYNPLPEVLKNTFIILYFMICAYGVFLIWKD